MSEFLTPLRVQLLDELGEGGRSRWILLHPLRYQSDLLGRIYEVPTGTDTDFASIPRGLFTDRFLGYAFKASVLHDYAYQTKNLTKELADELFKEAMLVDDLPVAQAFYLAVKFFGMTSYDPDWKGWE